MMMNKESWRQHLNNLVRRDLGRKLVALFLAALIYLAVAPRTGKRPDISFSDVALDINLPPNIVLSEGKTYRVKLTLSGGSKEALDKIDPSSLRVLANVAGNRIVPGKPYKLHLRHSDVKGLAYGVRVETIVPQDFEIKLEPLAQKQLPIRVQYDSKNKLHPNYEITDVRFVPSSVEVSGLRKTLEQLHDVCINPIPIDENVTDSFTWRCTLLQPPGTTCNLKEVDAHVEVKKVLTTHQFRSVPLLIMQNAERTRKFQVVGLEPESVTVVLSGPRGTLARMNSRDVSASISLDNIDKPGTYNLPVSITVNNSSRGVVVKSFQPTTAQVVVKQE